MNWAIVFLACGDEHIKEFNIVAKTINELNPKLKIIVGTDTPENITANTYKTIHISEPFNYNLKRIPIREALDEFNTILFLDTDTYVRNDIDFSIMNNISDGLYVDDIVPPERQDRNGSIEWIQNYIDKLNELWPHNKPQLIPEGRFILKWNTTEQRNAFIEMWERGYNWTVGTQPEQYGLSGCMEGFLIWIAAMDAGIPVKKIWNESETHRTFFQSMVHFASPNKKLNPTIL
jgi:hypothetical protein